MRIASFNINGIRARLPVLLDWLRNSAPDIACLQEVKATDDVFPRSKIEALGYRVETLGQKGFNGVAILSRQPLEDVRRGLPGDEGDAQARWIEALVCGRHKKIRVCCLYLPNGNPAPGPKYDYKLDWMRRLENRAMDILATEEIATICGDYNVIPEDRDAANPLAWQSDALALPETRTAFHRLQILGLTDAYRTQDQKLGAFSFWDYQAGAWARNDGIRIDHHMLTPQAADLLANAWIEVRLRAGGKPSDHVPVWADLDA